MRGTPIKKGLVDMGKANELTFQKDMIQQFVTNGWLLGKPENYNRELALYTEDLLGFVKETQENQWQKYCKLYPNNPEQKVFRACRLPAQQSEPQRRR